MDLNGDGFDDIISGSYMPGHLYVFEGISKGEFAKGREILDKNGKKLLADDHIPESAEYTMQTLASVPYAADIDDDGDFDLLVGNIIGDVALIENEGTATNPQFGRKTLLEAGGEPIRVGDDSGPVAVDWDGDELLDLIVGTGDGAVWYYRNTGTKTEPAFAKGEALIPAKSAQDTYKIHEPGYEPTGPGSRTKVCVTDYNRDGRLDLLVGDVMMQNRPEPELTEEQRALRTELEKRGAEIQQRMNAVLQKIMEDLDPSQLNTYDFTKNEEYLKISEEMTKINEQLEPLRPGMADYHGWVWVYLRKATSDQ